MSSSYYKHYCRGVSLIEVMVTVVILSIGALGMAVMQAQTKLTNHQAIQRTLASMLANDIIERLRANADPSSLPTSAIVGGNTISTEPSPDCESASCTPAQLYAHDMWEWEQLLDGVSEVRNGFQSGGLNFPTGCVTGTGTSGLYTIAIAWRGNRAISNPTADDCGAGSSKYDDADGNPDLHRRVLTVDVYVDAS